MMTRHPSPYGPSLLVGAGILLATITAVSASGYGWPVMAGPLLLAVAVIGADVWESLLRGGSVVPNPAALRLASAFMLSGSIVALRDPDLVATLIPVIGGAGWIAVANRAHGGHHAC